MIRAALLALLCLFGGQAVGCENPVTPDEWRNLNDILGRRNLGDVVIGVVPGYDGRATRFLQITGSGCYRINQNQFGSKDYLYFWLNNVGDWEEGEANGSFVVISALSMLDKAQKETLAFFRNKNAEKRKTMWAVKAADGSITAADYTPEEVSAEAEKSYYDPAMNEEKFDALFPSFNASLADVGASSLLNKYRVFPYLLKSRITKEDIDGIGAPQASPRVKIFALGFDAASALNEAALPQFTLNMTGPCTLIRIEGPTESFRKELLLQRGPADCRQR